MTTAAAQTGTLKLGDLGASTGDKFQTTGYVVALTQVAAGIMSALYVLITQAVYFGHSLKFSWDHLNTIWHFRAVPLIGGWLYAHYDIGRHTFLRNVPISILAFALVAMVVPKLAPMRAKIPAADRLLVFLRMPSRYQHLPELRRLHLPRRPARVRDRTTPLQFLFLLPSMLFIALPGEILMAAVIFGGIALAHRAGISSPWLDPESPWVPIVIGVIGGAFYGHKPAVKAGDTVQLFFLGKRRAVAYHADRILAEFRDGRLSRTDARNQLTALRSAAPSGLYPPSYRKRYAVLLADMAPVRTYSWVSSAAIIGICVVLFVLACYGLFIRYWGIKHGFWIP